jgi:hypothetical protein
MPPRTSIWIAATRLLLGSIAPLVGLPRDLDVGFFSKALSLCAYGIVVAVTSIYPILDMIDVGLDRFVMINAGPKRAAAGRGTADCVRPRPYCHGHNRSIRASNKCIIRSGIACGICALARPSSGGAVARQSQSQASPTGVPERPGNARCDRLLSCGTARPISGVDSFRRRARDAREPLCRFRRLCSSHLPVRPSACRAA